MCIKINFCPLNFKYQLWAHPKESFESDIKKRKRLRKHQFFVICGFQIMHPIQAL